MLAVVGPDDGGAATWYFMSGPALAESSLVLRLDGSLWSGQLAVTESVRPGSEEPVVARAVALAEAYEVLGT